MSDPIKVFENTDPLIKYKLTDELGEPFDLTPYAHLDWYVRDTTVGDLPDSPNRSSLAVPGGITVTSAANGECSVQARSEDLGSPDNKWCFLVGVTAAELVTMLSFRQLKVQGL